MAQQFYMVSYCALSNNHNWKKLWNRTCSCKRWWGDLLSRKRCLRTSVLFLFMLIIVIEYYGDKTIDEMLIIKVSYYESIIVLSCWITIIEKVIE